MDASASNEYAKTCHSRLTDTPPSVRYPTSANGQTAGRTAGSGQRQQGETDSNAFLILWTTVPVLGTCCRLSLSGSTNNVALGRFRPLQAALGRFRQLYGQLYVASAALGCFRSLEDAVEESAPGGNGSGRGPDADRTRGAR
eukprot:gene23004-biopygen8822